MNKTKFSVMDASKAFKKSRTTIYDSIKNGEISRDSDGLIDLSELIRVYGNPAPVQSSTRTEHVQKTVQVHVQSEIENVLKDQIQLLKNQLDLANQREKSLMQHIEDLTHRIEFKGSIEHPESQLDNAKTDTTSTQTTYKSEEASAPVEPVEEVSKPIQKPAPEPKKRGLLGRMLNAVLSEA